MNVIWHDYVAADPNLKICGAASIGLKSNMDGENRKNFSPPMRIERDEINRRVVAGKNQLEPRWRMFNLPLHAECCSLRCPSAHSDFEVR